MKPRIYVQLSLMMFLEWFIMGAWYVTVGNYMKAHGMSEHIHWAYTVVPISALVSPYFLGLVADRYFATEKILAFLQLAGGIAIFCSPWAAEASWGSALLFIGMLMLHALFFAPTIGLTTSLAFHHLTNQEKQFPLIRVFGTVGWIVAGFLVSKVLEADETRIPLQVAGGASVLMGFFSLSLPHTPPPRKGHAVSLRDVMDFSALRELLDRPLVVFLVSMFLIFIPSAAYYNYAAVFVDDVGLSHPAFRMSFGQMSEVLFMLIIPLLFTRLGVKWMIVAGILAWSLRYSLFALSAVDATPSMIMTAIILHGICFDFLYVVGQIYVDKKSTDATRGQAQGLFVFVTTGLGQLAGAQLTGKLYVGLVEAEEHHPEAWQDYWTLPAIASGILMLAFIIFFHDHEHASQNSTMLETESSLTYQHRLAELQATKRKHTREKQERLGPMDYDDQGQVLPPPEISEVVEVVGGSGVTVRQVVLKDFRPVSNHPSGGFFGPRSTGENFRELLAVHPTYIDPVSSLCGVYMTSFMSSRQPDWHPEFDFSHLRDEQQKYGIDHGIGGVQHFCPDLSIGLELGWGGLRDKVKQHRGAHPEAAAFYDGLEAVLAGVQDWIGRHASDALELAALPEHSHCRENLEEISKICKRLVTEAPRTVREACQWLVFFQAVAKMYNGSGEWGQLDELLRPYYEQDTRAGILTDEEAVFHIACLLLTETAYIQVGGPDTSGRDLSSSVSFLILEAIHRLKIPANIAVRVSDDLDPQLFRRGVEILLEDKMGFPKFLGDDPVNEGFMRNGYPLELARQRIYAGCHWVAIPGREYGMNDLIKIEMATILDLCLREMLADEATDSSVQDLWDRFVGHLRRAVEVTARGIDLHMRHMHEVFPELLLDLFCHGPVEKGLDATQGGVEHYNIAVDGASLATVADSFAALEQRVETEQLLTWEQLLGFLDRDWAGPEGESARLKMKNIPRFGSGGSHADDWALRISETFSGMIKEKPTPDGFAMVPGLFSWAKVIEFGKNLGATPNGRHARQPLSHGPNPDPGFNEGRPGVPTQLVHAVAAVQPGYGNPASLQLDLDPGLVADSTGVDTIEALLQTHFDLGGTLVNINVMDKAKILEAYGDPSKYPDLIVRVTGFSAYFASLSDELRKYVVDRIV